MQKVKNALNASIVGLHPDFIPGQVLQKCSISLSVFLYILEWSIRGFWRSSVCIEANYHYSCSQGWLESCITIYRTIASFYKSFTFDRIIYATISKHLQNKLSSLIFGFWKSRSCAIQPLCLFHKNFGWIDSNEKGYIYIWIYIWMRYIWTSLKPSIERRTTFSLKNSRVLARQVSD